MAKKKKAEARSRANHPTAKTPLDPQATIYTKSSALIERGIPYAWAHALSDAAVLENFRRLLDEPKGWKKVQKEALLAEVFERFRVLFEFQALIQEQIDAYANALRAREHGGLAQDRAIKGICAILEHYNHPNPSVPPVV